MRTTIKMLLVGALLASGACKNKAEQADEAQETANEKAVEAAEAQREANEKAVEAERERAAKIAEQRDDARENLQDNINAADRKIAHLRGELLEAKGTMRKNADAAANEVQLRKAKLDADMQNLNSSSGDAWDAAKLRVEADIAALNEAVDNLEKTLKD